MNLCLHFSDIRSSFIALTTALSKDKLTSSTASTKAIKIQVRPFTVSGLADALDMSRQSLLNYSEKEEFFDTIMRAKRKCEVYAEEMLFDKNSTNGAKFSLANNFEGWREKQEVEHSGSLKLEDVL